MDRQFNKSAPGISNKNRRSGGKSGSERSSEPSSISRRPNRSGSSNFREATSEDRYPRKSQYSGSGSGRGGSQNPRSSGYKGKSETSSDERFKNRSFSKPKSDSDSPKSQYTGSGSSRGGFQNTRSSGYKSRSGNSNSRSQRGPRSEFSAKSPYSRQENFTKPRYNRQDSNYIGGDLVVGKRAVYELLITKHRQVSEILVAATNKDPVTKDVLKLAESVNVRWNPVSQYYLDDICEMTSHQSIVAKCRPLEVYSVDDLVEIAQQKVESAIKVPLLVALDEIVDVQNIGAILRNASCFGAVGIILPVHRSVKITPAVTKIAAGAIEHLRFSLVGGIPNIIQSLKDMDVSVVGLDGSADKSVGDLKVENRPLCLVVGSEENGISQLARKRCDVLVNIPQLNNPSSLNAASASAIGLYEISKKLVLIKNYSE